MAVFQENEYTVKIADKEFEFDSLDELMNKRGKTPSNFEISGRAQEEIRDSISISFEQKRTFIHLSSSSNAGKITFVRLKEICESHISIISKILNPWVYMLPVIIVSYFVLFKPKEEVPIKT